MLFSLAQSWYCSDHKRLAHGKRSVRAPTEQAELGRIGAVEHQAERSRRMLLEVDYEFESTHNFVDKAASATRAAAC